jgi:hypothetical protein
MAMVVEPTMSTVMTCAVVRVVTVAALGQHEAKGNRGSGEHSEGTGCGLLRARKRSKDKRNGYNSRYGENEHDKSCFHLRILLFFPRYNPSR